MNRIFAKTRVFALSSSEETMNDIGRFDTISECDRQADKQTDRDGRTSLLSLLLQYQRMHELLCYRVGKISCFSLSFLGPSPDSLPGLCFWIPLGDFSFASHHLISNPEYAPELGAAFSTPAFSTPAILMVPRSNSRVFSQPPGIYDVTLSTPIIYCYIFRFY